MTGNVSLGANYLGAGQSSFLVWGPALGRVELHLVEPEERVVLLKRTSSGYHETSLENVFPGARYFYRLENGTERPDPASRFQPGGVHGASEVVEPVFAWRDQGWKGLPLRDYILYELHVGTFGPGGTFDAIITRLPELKELGVTALELMPVAQFPGSRNWGYDGVYPFAVQNSYGGPYGLKRLVNACHEAGMAVVLDVVYNHLGPEGNYFSDFGPYFNEAYRTPWGAPFNLDSAGSDEVRRFFIENAFYWQREFHMDGLRLDAVHAMKDFSATPFLQELARETHRSAQEQGRPFYLIAESDLNDARLCLAEGSGGYDLDAQWSDDFHHCLHVQLTGEREGYYGDFDSLALFAKVWREGWGYAGQYSPARQRRHGNSPMLLGSRQLVVCSQNHDQIGNRPRGDRLTTLVSAEGLKLAAASVLLSPFIPLLFMGEEYGEPASFQYIISHSNQDLIERVRRGRREEFSAFGWRGKVPDPQAEATFEQCILDRELRTNSESHRQLYEFYRELIRLRKELPSIAQADKSSVKVMLLEPERVLCLLYARRSRTPTSPGEQTDTAQSGSSGQGAESLVLCFSTEAVPVTLKLPSGRWKKLVDSTDAAWGGRGSALPEIVASVGQFACRLNPLSAVLFHQLQPA
jgi:maltooligosyltrehalose trehalohydrolase